MKAPTAAGSAQNFQLQQNGSVLELHDQSDPKTKPLSVDFTQGSNHHRLRFGGGKGQAIAKAIGLHKHKNPNVTDLTAGLGREGFVLASLGCKVTLVERNPTVWALLANGIERAKDNPDPQLQEIIQRITLVQMDAHDWLANWNRQNERPDIIYLDPMFPQRTKSALVKKEMRFFHDLVGNDHDADSLLEPARHIAKHRVVVKRPSKAPELDDCMPAFTINGKTTRYDIYLPLVQTASQPDQDQK